MPIGIQRLNSPRPQPTSQIVFIKPLPGADEAYAQDFLERIAAICHPIMKANHLSITTLEEHEPNREFVGRNFNAGEIIQLVLKSQQSPQQNTQHGARWLSFRTVQMVMMHELAHCMQMNHSRAFWKVRNQYAEELRVLWGKGYTGDGLWGRGQTLLSGRYHTGGRTEENELPTHLCGGAYRSSRRRKRKRGMNEEGKKTTTETHAERQQRRIAKKFGVSGQPLGGDTTTRIRLEKGQEIKGNPRVANSSRGRELRIAAALARFGQQKDEVIKETDAKFEKKAGAEDSSSESEEGAEELEFGTATTEGGDNHHIHDHHGRDMVRVCGNEDEDDDIQVKQEMDELRDLDGAGLAPSSTQAHAAADTIEKTEDAADGAQQDASPPSSALPYPSLPSHPESQAPENDPNDLICPICSMSNHPKSSLCAACSHVLDTDQLTNCWTCRSSVCVASAYRNAGDCGICGVCGKRRVEV